MAIKRKNTLKSFLFSTIMLAFAVLFCVLGNWQLQRLSWKTEILNKLDHAQRLHPSPLTEEITHTLRRDRFSVHKIQLEGRLFTCQPHYLINRSLAGTLGYEVLLPIQTIDQQMLLIQAGWSPIDNEKPAVRSDCNPSQDMKILTGLIYVPRWSPYTPEGQVAPHQWVRLDPLAIVATIGNYTEVLPFVLQLDADSLKSLPPPYNTLKPLPSPSFSNNHAQYALFWFGMAALLIVLTAGFLWRRPPS